MQQRKLISILAIILFTLYLPITASANYSLVQGRWLERDNAAGYADGMNLYEYSRSSPVVRTDAHGNISTSAGQSQAKPKPKYSCKKGSGRQVKDPTKKGTSDYDVCCTLACLQNRNKKPYGRTVCCGKDPTSCVCDINIDNKFPGKGLDCFRKALKKCTGQHEPIHQKLVDC